MATFILGLVILVVGALLYGKLCEKVFGPDDRKTPAYTKEDGVANARQSHHRLSRKTDPSEIL